MASDLDFILLKKKEELRRKKEEEEKALENNNKGEETVLKEIPDIKIPGNPEKISEDESQKKSEASPQDEVFKKPSEIPPETENQNPSPVSSKDIKKPPVSEAKKTFLKPSRPPRSKKSISGSHLRDFPTDLLNIAKGEFIGFNQTEAMAASFIKAKGLNPYDFDISDELKDAVKNSKTGDTFKSDMAENYRLLLKANLNLMKEVREMSKTNARLEMALSYIIFDRSGFAKRISSLKDIDFTDPSVLMVKKILNTQSDNYMKREKDREGRSLK